MSLLNRWSFLLSLIIVILLAGFLIGCTQGDRPVKLIPLEVLFGNPDKYSPQLSPNGEYLTYIAPKDGVVNVWIRTAGKDDDHPLTQDEGRGIRYYIWAWNGDQVLYIQDLDGDENWRLFAVDVKTAKIKDLTPPDPEIKHRVQVKFYGSSRQHPDEIIIGLNKRDERTHDVYTLNTRTGATELIEAGEPAALSWVIDHNLTVRGYTRAEPDGGATLMLRDGGTGPFKEMITWGPGDILNSSVVSFTADNSRLYLLDSRNRNAAALVLFDPLSGESELLAADDQYDVSDVEMHPTSFIAQAVMFKKDRAEWRVLDPAIEKDIKRIEAGNPGDFNIINRTLDDSKWLVSYNQDNGPIAYYSYDRGSGKLTFMFNHREALADEPLVHMKPIKFTSRDGLEIHGYLTLPKNWKGPGPLVLDVHGGPWFRDYWGFNPEAQWLANRGYACLQVNFRGSTGYGKDFVNAGDREWGGKMQDDLTDAVKWAVDQGIADPEKVAIFGGSYGGYAALAGVTFTPDLYAAAVSSVGPSNLETFLNTIPPYWESFRKVMDLRVGKIPRYESGPKAGMPKDPKDFTDEDREDIAFLHSRSPFYFVNNIKVPVLVAQGANDPRVSKAESDQFVEAMKKNGLEVEYLIYENEGHGFARPENRLDFYRKSEQFLAKYLGGRSEK